MDDIVCVLVYLRLSLLYTGDNTFFLSWVDVPIIGAYYCRDKWPVNIANGSDDAESEVYERRSPTDKLADSPGE